MRFWKMHGLGNDYVVIDNQDLKIRDEQAPTLAKKLCDRRFSVGADGLLLVCPSKVADVEMCGNGIRCFSKYCYENGIAKKTEFPIETLSGIKHVKLTLAGAEVVSVKVDMGAPNWQRKSLPMLGEGTAINDTLTVDDELYHVTCLSMGNPHCVTFVEDVVAFPVDYVGPIIENDKIFPRRTNVGFAQILNRSEMKLRVWERGCGETLACGTGTCAAVVAANKLGLVDGKVTVQVPGGTLKVVVEDTVFLSGAAEKVFEGTLFKET
jgi:diaminopimelate epimerase